VLPFNLGREPEKLLPWLQERNAGVVVFDSMKDVITKLSDEEQAANFMKAVQACIAAGIQVFILHHIRKPNSDNKKPKTLADVHGSDNITRGCGSVITLWAPAAGATEVELNHVKPPAEPIGPFVILRNHTTGRSTRERNGTLDVNAKMTNKQRVLAVYREAGSIGVTRTWAQLSTELGVSVSTLRPLMAELKSEGLLEPVGGGDGGAGKEVQWVMCDRSGDVV